MSKWIGPIFATVVVVTLVGGNWTYQACERRSLAKEEAAKAAEEKRQAVEEERQAAERAIENEKLARQREYEEATRGPCGELVEMLHGNGDIEWVCARDVPNAMKQGAIVHKPDAGVE